MAQAAIVSSSRNGAVMAQKLIRDIPDEIMERIEERAQTAGTNAEAWIRQQLIALVAPPPISEQYAFRVYGQVGKGAIHRHSNHPNGTGSTFSNLNYDEADAMHRAEDFVRRNGAGDKERAYNLLVTQFVDDNVFEIPA